MSILLETRIAIAAPVEKVWTAITNPEAVKEYFFGTELVTTWQVGSPILFRGEWEGQAYEDKGIVLVYEPLKHIRYNYLSSWSNLEDSPENYANISYMLHEEGDHTVVVITQDHIDSEEQRAHSEQNWQMIFGAMKDMLEKGQL